MEQYSGHVVKVFSGFVSPTGITVTNSTVVVADGTEVKLLNLESRTVCSAISGMTSVGDVAMNADEQLTIPDPVTNKVLIFKFVDGKFEIENKFGTGLLGNWCIVK